MAIFVGLCDEADGRCEDAEGAESLSTGMQAVLICLEMFGASLVHRTVFSYKDYKPGGSRSTEKPKMGFCEAVKHSMDSRVVVQQASHFAGVDVVADRAGAVVDVVGGVGAAVGDYGRDAFGQVAEAVSGLHGGDRDGDSSDSQRLRV